MSKWVNSKIFFISISLPGNFLFFFQKALHGMKKKIERKLLVCSEAEQNTLTCPFKLSLLLWLIWTEGFYNVVTELGITV